MLWDTAGQEIFKNVVPIYFRNASAAILVFDLDDIDSFNDLDSWLETIQEQNDKTVPVVVVGNKFDVCPDSSLMAKAKQWSFEHRFPFFVTSAATGQGVKELFEVVGSICATQTKSTESQQGTPITEEKSKGCC